MKNKFEKPTPEAKALSLFLMAHKSISSTHKEKSIRFNKLWKMVSNDELDMDDYLREVHVMLESFGGYTKVVEKTVSFYINKSGEWKLKGNDKYCLDAQKVADGILNRSK